MNKHTFFLFLAIIITSCSNAQGNSDIPLPSGKSIYIPKELQGMDLQNPASQWSYHRMAYTENFIIFWEKGFGNDLSNPPQLEGHSMKVNLPNLKEKLESFYTYFYHTLQFAKQGSKCDKYRMMVMINYSLEGTAYGGDYDGQIGALWITPNRVQDEKLNCIAHELGHSFQSQITCDGQGEAWGGCGFFEMTSQWMLWQVNPDWMTDEKYHWDAFKTLTHKAYLHLDNIYHSPYVLEYWGIRHGLPFIAELYRQGKRGEDPVITYKRLNSLGQKEFCNEMFDACRHFVNWDFKRVWKETRPYANQYTCKMNPSKEGWYRVAPENCPENYGFNAVPPLRSPTGECRGSGVPWGGRQGGLQFRPPGESRLEIRFCRCHSGRKIRLRGNGKQHERSGEVYCSQGCTVGLLVVGCHGGPDGTLDESHIRGKRCTMAL